MPCKLYACRSCKEVYGLTQEVLYCYCEPVHFAHARGELSAMPCGVYEGCIVRT